MTPHPNPLLSNKTLTNKLALLVLKYHVVVVVVTRCDIKSYNSNNNYFILLSLMMMMMMFISLPEFGVLIVTQCIN